MSRTRRTARQDDRRELAEAQKKADTDAFKHWKATTAMIVYDGKNNNLCTVEGLRRLRDAGGLEDRPEGRQRHLSARQPPGADTWDNHPLEGSGGLYNNEKNPSNPTKCADKPIGEWNRFRILMVGDKVTVYLNNELVVHNVTMENYWERDKPIYPIGQIELQHHGTHSGSRTSISAKSRAGKLRTHPPDPLLPEGEGGETSLPSPQRRGAKGEVTAPISRIHVQAGRLPGRLPAFPFLFCRCPARRAAARSRPLRAEL